ncbi:MAG: peptidylprolyl isomerase [Prolixibacteraceae bacterium]|jgi:cyclophilin family peptidyl-prolyl cis-trans isomerase|nr:peptidylprolyl isomerase [Prolixibacteraceae bacterium]
MLKRFSIILFLSGLLLQVQAQTYHAEISTNMGDMTFMLYDDTPLHRDGFIELTRNGHFENTLFYRVIEDYIIQGGSKDSRNAPPGKFIGYGDPTKTVNDEIKDHHICKKGALCAPRQPDEVNIFKQSDISQFFVVQGETFRPGQIDTMELAVNRPIKKRIYRDVYTPDKKKRLKKLKDEENWEEARKLANEIKDEIDVRYELAEGKLEYSEARREAYTTIGGAPQIENEYTVFGEIISGMEVIDKIAALKTDKNNRPYTDVVIHVKIKKNK